MPTFSSRSTRPSPLLDSLRGRPFLLFGLPFLSLVVVSSFALQRFTRTRYDLNDQKVQVMSKEQELGLSKDRKRVDIREEYYRLNAPVSSSTSNDAALDALRVSSPAAPPGAAGAVGRKKFSMRSTSQEDYEPVRVPRPEGVPEWGGGRAGDEAPVKGSRAGDRWV
ncbi:Flavin-linked sulfhydryl oxidase of the mitochondrial IMS [Cryptotrichosporon argae]